MQCSCAEAGTLCNAHGMLLIDTRFVRHVFGGTYLKLEKHFCLGLCLSLYTLYSTRRRYLKYVTVLSVLMSGTTEVRTENCVNAFTLLSVIQQLILPSCEA